MYVPLYSPWITTGDKKAILSTLQNQQLTDGPLLRKLESAFSKITGSRYAIGVSNGTAALHLSLISLGVGTGDEVIMPDMTFVATANAVMLSGATPVLADIDSTMNISVESIKEKISKKTRAIIPVHFAGYACNMDAINSIARKNNLYVIEDCAHSLGAYYNKKHVGTTGDCGCFSFYPTKNITTIEGGMIVTNSKKTYQKLSSLRNHGLTRTLLQRNKSNTPWEYDVQEPGFNYRLDEVRSSLGLSQLSRFKEITAKRTSAAKYYNHRFKNVSGIKVVNYADEKNHVYHLYLIRIKKEFGVSRNSLHKILFKKGIRTTVHYKPIHRFSYFKKYRFTDSDFPNSVSAFDECLTLPLFPTITKKQQDYVIDNILQLQK